MDVEGIRKTTCDPEPKFMANRGHGPSIDKKFGEGQTPSGSAFIVAGRENEIVVEYSPGVPERLKSEGFKGVDRPHKWLCTGQTVLEPLLWGQGWGVQVKCLV